MKQSLKIVFFGNEKIATGVVNQPLVFEALVNAGYDIKCLVVHSREAISRAVRSEAVVDSAKNANVPIINPNKLIDYIEQIKSFGADCGVLVAYGKIIPKEIIDIFPMGIVNIHPSLLPKLRGSTPVESALLSGQDVTGVSVMQLVPKMDAGPVLAQKIVPITPDMSKQELSAKLHQTGRDMMLEVLQELESGTVTKTEQTDADATFCTMIRKEDGVIDWNLDADTIARQVRAYSGWPGSRTTLGDNSYKTISTVVNSGFLLPNGVPGTVHIDQGRLFVRCGGDTSIEILTIQPDNKKEMPAKAFLSGYGQKIA